MACAKVYFNFKLIFALSKVSLTAFAISSELPLSFNSLTSDSFINLPLIILLIPLIVLAATDPPMVKADVNAVFVTLSNNCSSVKSLLIPYKLCPNFNLAYSPPAAPADPSAIEPGKPPLNLQ